MSFRDKQAVFAILQTTHDFFLDPCLIPTTLFYSLYAGRFSSFPATASSSILNLRRLFFSFTLNFSRIFTDNLRLFSSCCLVHSVSPESSFRFFFHFVSFLVFFFLAFRFSFKIFSHHQFKKNPWLFPFYHCFSIFSKAWDFFVY